MRQNRRGFRRLQLLAAIAFAGIFFALLNGWSPTRALPGYVTPPRVPWADVQGCNWCHGPGGPGAPNTFKNNLNAQGSSWNMTLANMDSDGDGFRNGEEVQELTGTWTVGTPNPGTQALISSPSNELSLPPLATVSTLTGINDSTTVSGMQNVSVTLSTTAGGSPVGITRVDYIFRMSGGGATVATFSSTSGTTYPATINTATVPNGTYEFVAMSFDRRAANFGGPRSATLVRTSVTVSNAPQITQQPSTQSVAPGGTATFTVTATNATSFRWRKNTGDLSNTGNISGATTSTLTITGVAGSDQGSYDVVITNGSGSVTSNTVQLVVSAQAANATVALVSQSSTGQIGDATSSFGSFFNSTSRTISADGRFIVFRSTAQNLSPIDNTSFQDIYVRDRKTNTTSLVSINVAGAAAEDFSDTAMISANGRYVAFKSQANDITTPGSSNAQIYRRDLQTNTTIPVSLPTGAFSGTFGSAPSDLFGISDDGRYICFASFSGNIGGTANGQNVFIRDCTNNVTFIISRSTTSATQVCDGNANTPAMTPDGRYVTFAGFSNDLAAGVSNSAQQIFRWDRDATGAQVVLVTAPDNTTTPSISGGSSPVISADGRYVAFESLSDELIGAGNDTNTVRDIYRRDMMLNRTAVVSARFDNAGVAASKTMDASTPAISADGRFVSYVSNDSNVTDPAGASPDTNGQVDVFRRDMNDTAATKTVPVSAVNGTSTLGSNGGYTTFIPPRMSDDGRFIYFESSADNLTSTTDTNLVGDLFRRDCQTNATVLISAASGGATTADGGIFAASLTGDGSTVAFHTAASNLLAGGADNNGSLDVYVGAFNSAPVVDAGADVTLTVGTTFSRDGSVVDPNGTDTLTATVDYNDGAGPQALTLSATKTFSLSKLYDSVGTRTVTVSVSDGAGGTGTDSVTVTIAAPEVPTAPAITSALTATATKGQAFTYAITASGTAPIAFGATGLPAGLAFDNASTISGTPTVSGAALISLTATNSVGSDSKILTLTIAGDGGANTPPVISSGPTATPSPAVVGQAVSFSVTATDTEGDLLAYMWDFGDNTVGVGAAPSKTYTAAGVYTAKVTVSDGQASVQGTVLLAVSAPGQSVEFAGTKGTLKLNFKTPTGNDSFALSGTVPLAIGFNPNGKAVSVAIGTFTRSFNLDAKGKSKDLKLTAKRAKTGELTIAGAKFSLNLKKQSLISAFTAFGFTNATQKKVTVTGVPVILMIGGNPFLDSLNFQYTATQGKTGSAKVVP